MNCELTPLPPLPGSWSALSWQQLCEAWTVKMRYGGNADVARPAALMALCFGTSAVVDCYQKDPRTGEDVYVVTAANGSRVSVTPRELSYLAGQSMTWFDFPYGDPGEEAVKDEKGKVVKEGRKAHVGYVSMMRDAMIVPLETLSVGIKHFALPQAACNNLTWHQYRSLQAIAPQMFAEGISDDQAMDLQAQFLANILTPRSIALVDTTGGSIRLRIHYEYKYNAGQADVLAKWFLKKMRKEARRHDRRNAGASYHNGKSAFSLLTLFHICFQAYQTALSYYAASYPLLFSDSGKTDPLRDALTGEVGTINTIMKYAGYAEQQQVYDSNLPFVLDILNTMTKEAKEIEKMNSKIKSKR